MKNCMIYLMPSILVQFFRCIRVNSIENTISDFCKNVWFVVHLWRKVENVISLQILLLLPKTGSSQQATNYKQQQTASNIVSFYIQHSKRAILHCAIENYSVNWTTNNYFSACIHLNENFHLPLTRRKNVYSAYDFSLFYTFFVVSILIFGSRW